MGNVLREIVSGDDAVHLAVWTTTPWTLTANMASQLTPMTLCSC
jgi:isoleucyl-tRNA synthetase